MKSICVFCGSSLGNDPAFAESAEQLGASLAERNITLVYGGARVGLMGLVADSVLKNGGRVVGVLPRLLNEKEIAHEGLSQLILCETMHERKMKMFELAEGFVALPGGFGTLEEVIEILTWRQLGLHQFPVGLLNINGYYDNLIKLFNEMENRQLLRPEYKQMALFDHNIEGLLNRMKSYKAPLVSRWINSSST